MDFDLAHPFLEAVESHGAPSLVRGGGFRIWGFGVYDLGLGVQGLKFGV